MMFNTWRVSVFSRNMQDGESEKTERCNTEQEAMKKYRDLLASYGNNEQTKACAVMVYNPDAVMVKFEPVDNSKYIDEE